MCYDYFALLGQPRRPWLDPEAVNAQFLLRSAAVHPDRVHNEGPERKAQAHDDFARLNAACRCLRDPKERIRHLLELERSAKVANLERLPSAAVNAFFELGKVVREADEFLARQVKSASPLAKVELFAAGLGWRERLEGFQNRLLNRRGELESELQSLSSAWEAAPPPGHEGRAKALPLDRLENVYREYSYLAKWLDQIRERILQLPL